MGLVAGATSGLFGIGGGIILVPALVLLAGLSFRDAVAASLLFILLTSWISVWRHWRHGNVRFRRGAVLGLAGLIGVLLGEWVDRQVTEAQLVLGFCLLLVWAAHHLVYGQIKESEHAAPGLLVAVGIAGGFVAKLFGIGGGIVVVPGLTFLGMSIHHAVGTSLVSVFINAGFATGINLTEGRAWAVWALAPALGAIVGAPLGVRQAVRTHAPALRRLFGLLMLFVALQLATRAV